MLAYDKALALNPSLIEARLGRGNVLYGRADYREAPAAYERLDQRRRLYRNYFGRSLHAAARRAALLLGKDRPSRGLVFSHDCTQQIAESTPSRAEVGLPESAFVFCSFNKSYKLNPQIFDIRMRLLKHIDGSVLWLAQDVDQATVNLRCEAAAQGIDPYRLIFAAKTPLMSDHLARHRLADLFLDMLPGKRRAVGRIAGVDLPEAERLPGAVPQASSIRSASPN